MSTECEALLRLYGCINSPVSAGRVRVTYSRNQVDAIINTLQEFNSIAY